MKIIKSEKVGKLPCFCVSTNTGQYETLRLTHHNSVLTQSVILHALSHKNNIALALIDIKQTEYTFFKGMAGVVGVANTVREAVEILRIARVIMYRRNKELAQLGIKSLTDYEPYERSGKVFITGREFDEQDVINVKIDDQEQSKTAEELVLYLKDELEKGILKEVKVCINNKDWITVNINCVDFLYKDEMQMLLILVDELAELVLKGGLKTQEGKEEDQMKDEIMSILSSIAQLGRSSGIIVQIATQKPNATVVPTILRSNLGWRAFCGRATETGASMVALDNNLATTIDNTFPGSGIVQAAGVPVFVRFYFSKFSDLEEYYKLRGLDELGYDPKQKVLIEELEDLSGSEFIDFGDEDKTFEFETESITIDQRQDQDWEEI